MDVEEVIGRFERVRKGGGGWRAKCPAHEDHQPSLQIGVGDEGMLFYCRAGCSTEAILAAVELRWSDVFFDADVGESRPLKAKTSSRVNVPSREQIEEDWDSGLLSSYDYACLLAAWSSGAKTLREEKTWVKFHEGEVVHYALKRKPERWGALPLGEKP